MKQNTRRLCTTLVCTASPFMLCTLVRAQADRDTATQNVRLQVYALGSYDRPQYGPIQTAGGFGAGGAVGVTVPHLHHVEPALDVRYTYMTNSFMTQTVLGGGLRVNYHVARFHPYGDIMVGEGNITFKQPSAAFPDYTHDNSTVLTFGGGLDYDLTRTFALRADIQRSRWQFAERNLPFYPTQVSFGLRYQFHFHNLHGPE